VAKTNNIIELNGKRFDAATGAFLGMQTPPTGVPKVVKPASLPRTGQRGTVMDSVMTQPASSAADKIHHMPVQKPTTLRTVKPLAPHKPEHTKTLMRHAVKQPITKPKTAVKLQAPTDLVKKQPAVMSVAPKFSSEVIDLRRSARAENVAKSAQVERFRHAPQPRRIQSAPSHRPAEGDNSSPHVQATRAVNAPARRANDNDMFERAITHAKSHEQAAPKEPMLRKAKRSGRKHTRLAGILASVLVVFALGGFIAFQNRANMELQLASSHAGFHASMPGYKPAGFAFKGLTYSPGTVTVGFHSGDKGFNVVQKASNWNSETLLENVVATAGQPYQAYQAAGRTVYVYGDGSATWVNGGVWYQVNGNATLPKDQLINLATSM
jgi:hypothetical protein